MKTLNLGNCAKIKEFEIYKNEIKEIPNNAFINCKNMTKLVMDTGDIEKTYEDSFKGLQNLESLTFIAQKNLEIFNNSLFDSPNIKIFKFSNSGSIEAGAL
ncbi:hypothetical protein PVAND_017611, partial [Polypedilum vanderplanki]